MSNAFVATANENEVAYDNQEHPWGGCESWRSPWILCAA